MSLRLGILTSHRGTNAQRVVLACRDHQLEAETAVIISNNANAEVLKFGQTNGIDSLWIGGKNFEDETRRDEAISAALLSRNVDLVLLLGYMRKLGPKTLTHFQNRILNIHPALLPKHGGKGKFGIHVHESVIASGDNETGVSIHLVSEEYDQGEIIAQTRFPVLPGDTPKSLQARVLLSEHSFLIETLKAIVAGTIRLPS